MTWLALGIGYVLGCLSLCLVWAFMEGRHEEEYFEEHFLDSEAEYVDNTPTFR